MFESITLVLAIVAVAHFGYFFFLFLHDSEDDLECGNSSESAYSQHPTTKTPLLSSSSSPNSYSQAKTNTRSPATYHHHQNTNQRGHSATDASHSHRASLASSHPQPAPYLQPLSSTCARPSHLQPSGSSRITQVAVKVKATRETDLASPRPRESRGTTGTSTTDTHASRPPQLSSTHVCQSEISTTATAGSGSSAYHTRLTSHYVAELGQTPSTFSHVQPPYLQPPSSRSITQVTANATTAPSTQEYDHAYRSNLVSQPHSGGSRVTIGTSTHTHASQPAQPSFTRVDPSEVSATTTPGHSNSVCRTGIASHCVEESGPRPSTRGKPAVAFATPIARTHVFLTPQSSSTRTSQSTTSTTTPAGHADSVHHSCLPQPCSTETSLTGLGPSPTQATYQCTRSPDVTHLHIPEDAEPRLTHSYTLSSSSNQVTQLAPSRVPNVQSSVKFEATTSVEDKKAAKNLRERARHSYREMCTARDLAESARKRGEHAVAQRHTQDAIAHECEMKSLDRRAANIIFRVNNEALPKGTVDLHGLYVAEAMECATRELLFAGFRNDAEIYFIVGKGLHSEDGQSKLRPHLASLCDERQLTYSLDPKNPGMLRVQLN